MLDGLLCRGFASKCKSLIKLTKSRIDVIRRKRNATLKFLKKDMADLLANGLDINAYGRAEGLMAEMMLSSCYDLVERYSDFVLKHLSVMQKMSHCPEDCKEAVSSLMSAAARFSDLPELRDLRQIFFERYGTSVELFANQKLLENLSSKPFTMEQKVRLMQDIASEFSINWDSNGFQQRMSGLPSVAQGKQKSYGSLHTNDDKHMSVDGKDTKGDKLEVLSKEMSEHTNISHRLLTNNEDNFARGNKLGPQCIHGVPRNGYRATSFREEDVYGKNQDILLGTTLQKHESGKEYAPLKAARLGSSSQRKKMESTNAGSELHDGRENTEPRNENRDVLPFANPDTAPNFGGLLLKNDCNNLVTVTSYAGQLNGVNLRRDFHEQEAHRLQHHYKNAIPPYTKPNSKLKGGKYEANMGSSHTGSGNVVLDDLLKNNRTIVGNWSEKIRDGAHYPDLEKQRIGHTMANDYGHENIDYYQDERTSKPMSKSRPLRRKHSKSLSSHNDVGNSEDVGVAKRSLRSRRRDDSRRGLQILFDDEHNQYDEEERMIDRLLIQYSKKPSAYESDKVRRQLKNRHIYHQGTEVDKSPWNINRDGPDGTSEKVPPPSRTVSLPREQTTSEAAKVFTRAASFQPDRSSPALHVHPKLPDYDDLAARIAALKG